MKVSENSAQHKKFLAFQCVRVSFVCVFQVYEQYGVRVPHHLGQALRFSFSLIYGEICVQ
jgi:hypothetical protein